MESVLSIFRSKFGKTLLLLTALVQPIEAFSANTCTIKEMPVCLDNTPCKTMQDPMYPNDPSKTIDVCLSTSPKVGALTSTASCWDWAAAYDCLDPNAIRAYTDQCAKIRDGKNADGTPLCPDYQEIASKCAEPLSATGFCPAFDVTYRCTTAAGKKYQEQTCGGVTLCQGGNCTMRDKEQSTSLSKVAAAAEAARQAGNYMNDKNQSFGDPNSISIFGGVSDNCSQNTLGLSDCCVPNAAGASQNNHAIVQTLMSMGFSMWIGSKSGSMYTFDVLYDKAANFLQDGYTAIINKINGYVGSSENSCMAADYASPTTTNSSITAAPVPGAMTGAMAIGGFVGGMYGNYQAARLAEQWDANYKMAGVLSAIGTSAGTVAGTYLGGSAMGAYYGFASGAQGGVAAGAQWGAGQAANSVMMNPYVIGAMLAIAIIMALLACEPQEAMLQMKLGAGICHWVGSYCGTKDPISGKCITRQQSYCCFNSKLPKIIQEQARPQIGRAWTFGGDPAHADCGGLTVAELQNVDFSKMDLSEFAKDMVAKSIPTQGELVSLVLTRVNAFFGINSTNPLITNGVLTPLPVGPGTKANMGITGTPPPTFNGCKISFMPQPPAPDSSVTGTWTLTECMMTPANGSTPVAANGLSIVMLYKGTCPSVPFYKNIADIPASDIFTLDANGAGTFTTTLPADCFVQQTPAVNNSWDSFVTEPTNGVISKIHFEFKP